MRIVKYRVEVEKENKRSLLVKEDAKNYGACDFLDSPKKISRMMCDIFSADKLANEHVWLLCLTAKSKLVGLFEVSHGGVDSSVVSPREILTRVCLVGTSWFVLVHNHPSGDHTPSGSDIKCTKKLSEASEILGVAFLDHIIIGDNGYFSMREAEVI